MKLLIADDSREMRALVRRVCAGVAAEVRECADGAAAIIAFEDFAPDWTVMDVGMPEVDGLATTRKILAAHPAARIVVITQHCGAEYEQAAHEAGACAFVNKSNLHSLLDLISPSHPDSP